MANFQPAQTPLSRIFLIEGGARVDHEPAYHSCMRAGSPSAAFGDVTKIECPDPYRYGSFEEIGQIQGEVGRPTMDLIGRYARDLASDMLRIAKKRCAVDVQVHFGLCKDPSDFSSFDKAFVLPGAYFTNWGAGDLGTLESSGASAIDETTSLSAADLYEILPLSIGEKAGTIVTNEVLDVVICGYASCGDCDVESDGCDHIYSITKAAGGSPSTAPDIVFSIDKGVTWYADDIDSLGAAEDPSAITCLGSYVVVYSNASNSLHYALKADVDDVDQDETWTEITTGFVSGGEPNDAWTVGNTTFICGDNGYVYKCTDPTAGVTVLDAGVATGSTLNAIHALSENFVVAVGNDGSVIWTANGTTFAATINNPVNIGTHLYCVWLKGEKEWLVGDSAGRLWYTLDQGDHWVQKRDFGAAVWDISFSNQSVGYVAIATSTPAGRIYRTFDGGYSWTLLPEGVGVIPANDRINALATCEEDPNFVVGVGLADTSTDGIIVVGED